MKIAMILTNGFDPDPSVYKEAKSLVKLGHIVEIICWDRAGKYIDRPKEIISGITIIRFFGNATYGTGYKQIGKFLKFKDDVFNYIKGGNFEAIHCHDFDGFFIGYLVNRKLNLRLTYDEHDLFFEYFEQRPGIVNKCISLTIKIMENFMLKKVDNHILVTPKMVEMYRSKTRNAILINNAPYKELFADIEKTPSEKLRIGYIGSVRYLEELKAVVDASQILKNKVEVIISGGGICLNGLKDYASKFNNVKITGPYSISEIEQLYKNIDVTFAFYPDEAGAISMPNKYYESIITETPIIANVNTEFGYEVKKNHIGFTIAQNNLKSDIEAILVKLDKDKDEVPNIISNMRTMKNDCYWESNESKLDEIYS